MADPRSPSAGGVFIALGVILGSVIGFLFDQVTAGLLAGLTAGVLISLAIWWRGREI